MFDLIFLIATFGVRFIVNFDLGRPYLWTHILTCPSILGGLINCWYSPGSAVLCVQ